MKWKISDNWGILEKRDKLEKLIFGNLKNFLEATVITV